MTSELRIKIAESLGSVRVLRYDEDANAALQLVEVLKKEGWSAHLDNMNDSLWECDFMRNREFYSASAPALPEAICLAYCAVRGIAEKGKEA